MHGAGGDVDTFGIAAEAGQACVQGLFVRDGRLLGNRTWFPKDELALPDDELLSAFVSQYYLGGREREMPKTVVVAVPESDAELLAEALTARAGRRVEVACQVRGQRARWVGMATDNARMSLASFVADRQNVLGRFVALQAALAWEDIPQRLECFDISHSAGEATVASCVVFDAEGPRKSDYRRYNIEGVPRGDDYGAIEQVMRRRYTKLVEGEGALPDVVIIDGGAGQLGRAVEVLQGLQVKDIAVLGIAKGPTRKAGFETILLAGHGELSLPETGGAMHLLQHIRDEAHRFAISGHRGRRQKKRRRSVLDDIDGVGPRRKRELLAHFGSVASIQGASVEEIAKVPGVSRKLAANIHGSLHGV